MQLKRRHFLALGAVAPLACAVPALAAPTASVGGRAFGSYWRLSCADVGALARAQISIEAIVASVNRGMSPNRHDSEIGRFNALSSTDWMPVSQHTQSVVAAALDMAQRCAGSFDPTVGPLVGRYGFGPIGGVRSGSYRQVALRSGAIRKHDARLSLDLCGIAKGHALDRIVAALDAERVGSYLIELGGEVFARGRHPSGRHWQTAIEDPRPGSSGLAHLLALDGAAIATSGNKVNSYELAGQRCGHIIDPLKASCLGTTLLSVSVIADHAMQADGLATGMMAMGLERASALAESQHVDALLLVRDGRRLKTISTGRFADRILA